MQDRAAGICDSHVHVIGPKTVFPPIQNPPYIPQDSPVADLSAMMEANGISRTVIVQPSFYGADNRCTLDGVRVLGMDRARAVVCLPEDVTPQDVDAWHEQGARGVRINFGSVAPESFDEVRAIFDRTAALIGRLGWHIQIFCEAKMTKALAPVVKDSPLTVVFDHFGTFRTDNFIASGEVMVDILKNGPVWVKISGIDRIKDDIADPEGAQVARAYFEAAPDRVVWGSDWPHTPKHQGATFDRSKEQPSRNEDDARLLGNVTAWLGEADARKVLIENPDRLYFGG